MNQTENIYTPDEAGEITIELKCDIEGMPTPVISWWKVNNFMKFIFIKF